MATGVRFRCVRTGSGVKPGGERHQINDQQPGVIGRADRLLAPAIRAKATGRDDVHGEHLVSGSRPARTPEGLVLGWIEAFNARDLDRMLMCLDEDVDFHPLRLSGLESSYRGHAGVRQWFEHLSNVSSDYRLAVDDTRDLGDGRVVSTGSLLHAGETDIGPFSALYRIDAGLIAVAHQYLTDPDTIERIGLIP